MVEHKCCDKELIERKYLVTLSLSCKAQCDLNLSKDLTPSKQRETCLLSRTLIFRLYKLEICDARNTERTAMCVLCSTSERQFALNTFILPADQNPKAIGITTAICQAMFAVANAQQHIKSRTQAFQISSACVTMLSTQKTACSVFKAVVFKNPHLCVLLQ